METSGNPARGQGSWKEHLEKLGRRVEAVNKHVNTKWDEGFRTKAIQFKMRFATHGDVLVVVTVDHDGQDEVAFVSAPDFEDALSLLGGQLLNGKLNFREDKPYDRSKHNPG